MSLRPRTPAEDDEIVRDRDVFTTAFLSTICGEPWELQVLTEIVLACHTVRRRFNTYTLNDRIEVLQNNDQPSQYRL